MGQISAAAFQQYDPTTAANITPGPLALYTVQVGSIEPTQLNEGYAEVAKKASAFDLETAAQVQASLLASIEPVVIGPDGQLYLTDGHHTFTALDDSIFGSSTIVYVNVIANYSTLTTTQFFAQMQAMNYLLPINDGVPETVNDATGAPIPTSLTGLTNDPYRGLEYSILKNKNSKLFTTTSNITGAKGTAIPGLDKMTGFYSDFLEAAAYRSADSGLGLPYLSAGDIALSSQWNLNSTMSSAFTLPNIAGPVYAYQLPGFILSKNLVQGGNIAPTVISNTTLANGALDGNGTFTGITTINAGTASNPIIIGTPNTGFILELGADAGFTVTLNGGNTYTGGTSILAGTLIVTSDAALGAGATGATIDTTNLKASVQAANGIIFNSLSEGNGTLQIGTSSGAGTSTFTTNRVIAVGSEAATINLNGYLVSLTGALYSLGTAGVGLGNATGFSDLTIDDNSGNVGVLTLATASPNFYGNIIIGLNNKPTVRVMSDAALGATTGNVNAIGQIELNGGTLQAGASFTATERNIFLGGGSTIDLAGFATSWGTLSDTQRVLTIANSSGTAASGTFVNFTIASMASLVLTNSETVTFTNGFVRSGTAAAIIQAAALGTTQKLMSGSAVALVDGIAQAWIVTNSGAASSVGPYDFVTYGANGYVIATYGASPLSSATGASVVKLSAASTTTGSLAAYALNTNGKAVTVSAGATLTIGDGTSADVAGLILASGTAISGGTLAFGGSEGEIWLSGSNPTISSTITGTNGLTFSGSGAVALSAAASLSGAVTINAGTVTLSAANVFATDTAGVLLQDTKSTPAKATLAITANNAFTTLNSAGTNSAITIATGTTLTIGDTTNNLSSTLSSTITGAGTATIVKAGSGLLDLSAGKVTSVTTISATGGALRVAVGTSATVNYVLSNSADLQFAQSGGGQYSGAISGAGTLHLIGGTLQLTGTANTYSGGTIVETGSTLDLTTANLSTANANITDAGGLILFDQTTSGTFSGVISDGNELGTGPSLAGSLDKDDSTGANAGNLTIAAVQTYTGATYDEAGTLTLGAANAIASSSGLTLGRVGGGATATLVLAGNEALQTLSSNASNTTQVTLNGFALTVAPGAGVASSYGGSISNGTAAGTLVKSGAGTFVLATGSNSYSGGTTVVSGTLDLAAVQAAGTGTITFGATTPTLAIEQAALTTSGTAGTFSNVLSGFVLGDVIDLKGIGAAATVTYNSSSNQLSVTGGSESVTLQFDGTGAAPTGVIYAASADAGGTGTNVFLDADPIVSSISANPSSGYEMATQTLTISIVTNKVVVVSGAGPTLTLSDGGTATYTSSTSTANSTTLVFTTTVAQGQSAAGVSITSVSNGATVADAYGAALNFSNALNQAAIGPTIDTTAPMLAITSAAGLTNLTTQTITGTADDTSQPLYVYEGSNATLATYTGGNDWSATVTLSGNGNHTFYAQETDAAGNVGTSSSVTYTLQSTGPSVTLTAGQGGITTTSMQTLTGTVDVGSDPEAVGTTVTILNGTTGVGTGTVASNGAFSANVTLPSDGTYSLKAADTDSAGNTGYSTAIGYTLDTMPPDTSITTEPAAISNTSSAAFIYTGTDSGGTGVASYETEIDSAGFVATTSTTATYAGLADGSHTFQVEAVDQADNVDPTPATYSFLVDTTPPDTIITAEPVADSNSKSASFTYTGTDAGSGIASYKTSLDGSAFTSTTNTTASYIGLADGQHIFMVEAVDAAGNVDPTPATYTWTVDTTPPTIGINNTGGATDQSVQTITGSVDVADANSLVTLSVNGSVVTQTMANAQGVFAANVALGNDGTYVVKASDTDGAGNTGSASVTFQLNTVAPDVAFTTQNQTVYTPEQTVSGTVGTADAGTTVTVYDGATALGTAIVGSSGMWSTSVLLSGNGTHSLVAKDIDAAGNTGASNPVNLTLDTTTSQFTKGNLVLSVSGDGDGSGSYGDNQASPVVLEQVTTNGTFVNQLTLPQSTIGANSVFSGEYGSSSEGSLELSADGKSLTIAGYAINANVYNTGGAAIYGNAALAQSTSLTNQSTYTPVGRVIADISSTGVVDTSTVLFNVFDTNNPRSVATINGSSFYIAGQGVSGDTTQGVFYAQDGASSATAIYTGTDARIAEIYDGVLYVSSDSKQPKSGGGTADIASYGALPTSATTPVVLNGISKSVILTATQTNTINAAGQTVNLDPENFFFANSTTLYVADGGIPKQGGVGDGGLQKWSYNGTAWVLDYTLSQGLGIVPTGSAEGTTGLIGLTGKVVGNTVELYATNQTVGDLDQKYLFGITDQLNATSGAGESFTTLVTAAPDTNIRGVSFAPSTSAPVVAITSAGGLTNKPTQVVSGTVDVADSGTTVLVVENGATLGSALVGIDGSWTTSVILTGDGMHTLTATDTDAYGNTGTSGNLVFTLDTIAPVVTITAPAANSSLSIIDPTISGTVDTADAGTLLSLDTGQGAVVTTTVAANGTWSVHPTYAADGTYTITASDTDAAGNLGQASESFTINSTPNDNLFGAVTHDVTSAGGNIYALYETILGRAPDALELESSSAQLAGGTSLDGIASTLLGSTEYANDYGTTTQSNSAFVNQLFEDGLHRAADPGGLAYWDQQLTGGASRADVAVDIATSPESQSDLGPTFQTGVFVPSASDSAIARLYYGLFDRAPDAGGLGYWEGLAAQGTTLSTIASDFISSPESASATQSNAQFVASLYEGALGRAPDASGGQYWTSQLTQGTSRTNVALGIAESAEAVSHLAPNIEQGFHIA